MNNRQGIVTAAAIAMVMALPAQAQTTPYAQGTGERNESRTLRDYAIVCSSYAHTRVMINGQMAIAEEKERKETPQRMRGAQHLANRVAEMLEHTWRPVGGVEREAMGYIWQWCQTLVR